MKLFGFWASPFAIRVLWALKLKEVAFDECVEEDLVNHGSTLLQYSHPHNKAILSGKTDCKITCYS